MIFSFSKNCKSMRSEVWGFVDISPTSLTKMVLKFSGLEFKVAWSIWSFQNIISIHTLIWRCICYVICLGLFITNLVWFEMLSRLCSCGLQIFIIVWTKRNDLIKIYMNIKTRAGEGGGGDRNPIVTLTIDQRVNQNIPQGIFAIA